MRNITWKFLIMNLFLGTILSNGNVAIAQSKFPYQCEIPSRNLPAVKSKSAGTKAGLPGVNIFPKLVEIYDGNYIKQGCQAFLEGKSWDDTCQNGKRPLDKIAEDIPIGFYQMKPSQAAQLFEPIRKNTAFKDAYAFCRANGFYTSFKN